MATALTEKSSLATIGSTTLGDGLRHYYLKRINELEHLLRQKTLDLSRLEAHRNELNSQGSYTLALIYFLILFWLFLVNLVSIYLFVFISSLIEIVLDLIL